MNALLSVSAVSKRFRGLVAVDRVSFDVPERGIFAIIGPNGAGKTTLFNTIAGVLSPDGGTVTFAGERIDGLSSDRICRLGVARTFQIVRPFPMLTVEENVMVGALLHRHPPAARAHSHEVLRRLLLDEVMAGLRPTETDRLVETLKELNGGSGLTILLIEHVMRAVMALATHVLVMHHGAAIAEGPPGDVVRDRAVIDSYLGVEAVI
jgi:branched-chain amino acid transport system ATP-binding protein